MIRSWEQGGPSPDGPRPDIPGWPGTLGPLSAQYEQPHVYARDVGSLEWRCVCGQPPTVARHVFVPPPGGELIRTYYRAIAAADGAVWMESRDRKEVEVAAWGHSMYLQVGHVYEVREPWRTVRW